MAWLQRLHRSDLRSGRGREPVLVSKQAEQLVSRFFPQKMEELQTLLKVVQMCWDLVSEVT